MRFQETHVLDIPDNYPLMAPELVAENTAAVEPILTRDTESSIVDVKIRRRRSKR